VPQRDGVIDHSSLYQVPKTQVQVPVLQVRVQVQVLYS